jgi:hypothetical protein
MKVVVSMLLAICASQAWAMDVACTGSKSVGMMYFLPDDKLFVVSNMYKKMLFGEWKKLSERQVMVRIPTTDGPGMYQTYQIDQLSVCDL